ncbi:hypothetical protein NE237_024956 [Protea cynaroides]|uniref:Ultraviolet-B receptor UVR8 n=1 Tax=Protea cynaroides TaxID=273540 RepID=A0A9Q0K0W4_9MAGN|nr:hypothetical protein NE237_024956 [Protea cynaroides]
MAWSMLFFYHSSLFVTLDCYLDGQLGLNMGNSLVPCFLEHFHEFGAPHSLTDESNANSKTFLKVQSIKAGGMMSLAIDSLGALWMWGNCPLQTNKTDGEFTLFSCPTPSPVWDFHGHTVVKVACGNEHVIALVSAGETYTGSNLLCYSWGNNNHGQLGLGDKESRSHPAIVETFNLESPWTVYEVACGAFHTAVLTHRRINGDLIDSSDLSISGRKKKSTCLTFGLGENGQLGHGTTKNMWLPEPVKDLPQNVFLTSIDCGLFHTCVVSSAGDVWSWGMEKGLGLCPDASFTGTDAGDALWPLRHGSKFARPVQVACGAAHTVLVSHDGYKLWSWGRGWSGVLGRGSLVDSYVPVVVMWPPLDEDFQECLDEESGNEKVESREAERATELEKSLSSAMEEVRLLRSKLNLMEKYASILHGSIFGTPFEELPQSLQNTGIFDIAKEWENMLESAEDWKLARLEMFYQKMVTGVKDKQMKRKIQEMVRECLHYSNYGKSGL